MKRIIKNKVYDTDTAKELCNYEPNPYRSDFHWYCETLYQKKTGEFFIFGVGNVASKYSKSCGQNEWCGSEKIVPLTYDEAREWAEQTQDGDTYIEIFGEPEEDDSRDTMQVSLTKTAIAKIKQAAHKQGITVSALIEQYAGTL